MRPRSFPSLDILAALSAAIFLGGFFLVGPRAEADIRNVTSSITANTTWTADHTYLVQNSPAVNSGVTLTIASGTIVKFSSSTLQINGTLNASGDPGSLSYFTSANDNSVGSTTPSSTGNPAPGDWYALVVTAGGSSTLGNAVVRYGGSNSSYYTNISVGGGTATFSNVISASSSHTGYTVSGGNANITSSTMSNNATYGISASGSANLTLASSTFNNNSNYAGY